MNASGKKVALVLLHGFCEDKTLWNHIIPSLTCNGEIIALNLPGFGNTSLPTNNISLNDIASIIKKELVSKGVDQCVCIGHSLGGYITLALKSQFPEFVKAIGLIHSTAFADTPDKKEARYKLVTFLDNHNASSFLSSFAPSLFFKENLGRLTSEIEQVINMSKGLTNKVIQQYALAMRNRENHSNLLYREANPLFIAGEQDTLIPIIDSKLQIYHISNQQNCYILPNTGHMGMYESPSLTIKAINQFLQ